MEKLRRRAERELQDDPPELPDALPIIQNLPDAVKPATVHEHHPVHELHAVAPTGGKNLLHIAGSGPHGLLGQHVFPCLGRAD